MKTKMATHMRSHYSSFGCMERNALSVQLEKDDHIGSLLQELCQDSMQIFDNETKHNHWQSQGDYYIDHDNTQTVKTPPDPTSWDRTRLGSKRQNLAEHASKPDVGMIRNATAF